MGPYITATGLAVGSALLGYLLRFRGIPNPAALRAIMVWIAVAPVIFFFKAAPMLSLAIAGVILLVLAPGRPTQRAMYYIMTLPAAPIVIAANIPFPGLNYLITIDFPKIAAAAILVPLLFIPVASRVKRLQSADLIILLFTLFAAVQMVFAFNFTSGLRVFVDLLLLNLIPFVALSRAFATADDGAASAIVWLFLAGIFSAVAVATQIWSWNFYTFATPSFFGQVRDGIVRVSGTTNPFVFGLIVVLGMGAVELIRREKRMSASFAWFWRIVLAVALILSTARGAMLAAVAMYATFWYFTRFPRAARAAGIMATIFVIAPLAFVVLLNIDFQAVDKYGTFEYRRQLLLASYDQIAANPIFGDPFFADSPIMQKMRQGEGIVDVVNHYLGVTLSYGFVGLALYLATIAAVVQPLLALGRDVRITDDCKMENERAFHLACLAAYFALLTTTSSISLMPHVGAVVLAAAAGFVMRARSSRRTAKIARTTADAL